jgi:hypothetical protein
MSETGWRAAVRMSVQARLGALAGGAGAAVVTVLAIGAAVAGVVVPVVSVILQFP